MGKAPINPFGAEFSRHAENIDKSHFKALSVGIGLGTAKSPVAASRKTRYALPQHNPFEAEQAPQQYNEMFLPTESNLAIPEFDAGGSFMPTPPPASPRPATMKFSVPRTSPRFAVPGASISRIVKFVIAHGFDLLIVGSSIVSALIVAGLVIVPSSGDGFWQSMNSWAPIKIFLSLGVFQLLSLLYLLFSLYWALFKLIVGGTLGQSFATFLVKV